MKTLQLLPQVLAVAILSASAAHGAEDVERLRRASMTLIATLVEALDEYRINNQFVLPANGTILAAPLVSGPSAVLKIPASYIGKDGNIVDAWGRPLILKDEGGRFVVYSVGPDGVDNAGSGDDFGIRK